MKVFYYQSTEYKYTFENTNKSTTKLIFGNILPRCEIVLQLYLYLQFCPLVLLHLVSRFI